MPTFAQKSIYVMVLCCVNKAWHAFVGQSLEWQAFEVVKSENMSYCQMVKWLSLKRRSFKDWLQFEVECFKYYLHMQNWMEPQKSRQFLTFVNASWFSIL